MVPAAPAPATHSPFAMADTSMYLALMTSVPYDPAMDALYDPKAVGGIASDAAKGETADPARYSEPIHAVAVVHWIRQFGLTVKPFPVALNGDGCFVVTAATYYRIRNIVLAVLKAFETGVVPPSVEKKGYITAQYVTRRLEAGLGVPQQIQEVLARRQQRQQLCKPHKRRRVTPRELQAMTVEEVQQRLAPQSVPPPEQPVLSLEQMSPEQVQAICDFNMQLYEQHYKPILEPAMEPLPELPAMEPAAVLPIVTAPPLLAKEDEEANKALDWLLGSLPGSPLPGSLPGSPLAGPLAVPPFDLFSDDFEM